MSDWTPSEADLLLLTADFHWSQIGRWTVEVGWFPPADPKGSFHCKLVLDGRKEKPIESLVTRDPEEMALWTQKQMREAAKRAGTL
jgi:hypothetical protein